MHFSDQPILTDFNRFLDYLHVKQPLPLTNDKMVLKGPDLLALNERMTSFQTPFVTNKSNLAAFNLLTTFFHIAQKAAFFTIKLNIKNTKPQLFIDEERVRLYDAMTDDEKYFFLLETFWCYIDWDAAFDCRVFGNEDFYLKMAKYAVDKKVTISDLSLKRSGVLRGPFDLFAAEIFSAFGFMDLVWDDNLDKRPQKYNFPYKEASITEIGKKILPILLVKRQLYDWQLSESKLYELEYYEDVEDNIGEAERKKSGIRTKDEKFEDVFLPHFKDLKIKTHLLPFKIPYIAGEYILKVALSKDLYRVISIGADHTYEDLHLVIQDAFGFDDDHLYAFFMDNERWSHKGLSFWSPNAEDGIGVDAVPIGKSTLSVGKNFLYLFDFGSEWRFQITVQAIHTDAEEPKEPKIIESVGEAPEQYDYGDEEDDDDGW